MGQGIKKTERIRELCDRPHDEEVRERPREGGRVGGEQEVPEGIEEPAEEEDEGEEEEAPAEASVGLDDWRGQRAGGGLSPDMGQGDGVEIADEEPAEGEDDQSVEKEGGAGHADIGEPAGRMGRGPEGVLGERDAGDGERD